MGRISKTDQSKYELLIAEGKTFNDCYYCGDLATTADHTPVVAAMSEEQLASYTGPWTKVRCCMRCWKRLYTANIANGAVKYGTQPGMMTMDDKVQCITGLIRRVRTTGLANSALLDYVEHPLGILVLKNMVAIDDSFNIGAHTYTYAELLVLQPAICMAYMNRPKDQVYACLSLIMSTLDDERLPVYKEILGLHDDQETSW
jgi:hypothetical protein